jgi:hypothetical protein
MICDGSAFSFGRYVEEGMILLTDHIADIPFVYPEPKRNGRADAAVPSAGSTCDSRLRHSLHLALSPLHVDPLLVIVVDPSVIHSSLHSSALNSGEMDVECTLISPFDRSLRASATVSASFIGSASI